MLFQARVQLLRSKYGYYFLCTNVLSIRVRLVIGPCLEREEKSRRVVDQDEMLQLALVALLLGFCCCDGFGGELPAGGIDALGLCALNDVLALVDFFPDHLQRGVQDDRLATALALHAGDDGGEAVEAVADGLATLLLGADVVLLLLGLGQARAVGLACGRALGGGHGARGVWKGR